MASNPEVYTVIFETYPETHDN